MLVCYKWSKRGYLHFHFLRSDVLGQVMPLVGRDWSQSGVARLFSAIKVCLTKCLIFFYFVLDGIIYSIALLPMIIFYFQPGKWLSTNIP
jgi:hypothetical protein